MCSSPLLSSTDSGTGWSYAVIWGRSMRFAHRLKLTFPSVSVPVPVVHSPIFAALPCHFVRTQL